jgi:hypothetical protein
MLVRHAIIDRKNVVVNIIVWEGAEWLPPRMHTVVRTEVAELGDIWDPLSRSFVKNLAPVESQ